MFKQVAGKLNEGRTGKDMGKIQMDVADKVVYQIYPKSFQDSNGDGWGDLNGIRNRLDYLADLGVDFLWLTPFFPSPQRDNGYDVANYRAVDPRFGTMEDLEALIAEAAAHGIGLMFDMVFNHTSTAHEWFQKALKGDEKYMKYYILPRRCAGRTPDELAVEVRRSGLGVRADSRQVVPAPLRCHAGRP